MTKKFKIMAICPIDLDVKGGCTPMFWQLFKELAQMNVEIIVIPAYGKGFSSLWWKYYSNPFSSFSMLTLQRINDRLSLPLVYKQHHEVTSSVASSSSGNFSTFGAIKKFRDHFFSTSYKRALLKCIDYIWTKEKSIDAVFIFNDIFNYITWLPSYIQRKYGARVVGYSADLPTYLWREESLRLSPFYNVDLSIYDAFIVNSKGVTNRLWEMGVKNTYILNFAADPELFTPIETKKDVDVSFYAYGSNLREEAISYMITQPSKRLLQRNFSTAGRFTIDLGVSKNLGNLTFARMKDLCFRSKVNLNITRKTFAETYCSSTARLFELAAMNCCIVSNPCKGMDEWFTPNKELFLAKNEDEAMELYEWLLSSDDIRQRVGERARERVCREHTYKHRAQDFLAITRDVCK